MKPINEQSCSITIVLDRPHSNLFSLSCACGTCGHVMSVTCELKEDGTYELRHPNYLNPSKEWRSKLVQVRTESGKLLILCAVCQSGVTAIRISSGKGGTFCLNERLPCEHPKGVSIDGVCQDCGEFLENRSFSNFNKKGTTYGSSNETRDYL